MSVRLLQRSVLFLLLAIPMAGVLPAQSAGREDARRGMGIAVGLWDLTDDAAAPSSTISDTPLFEFYLRKSKKDRLAQESLFGLMVRTVEGSAGKSTAYISPQITSFKLYPWTKQGQKFEPFVSFGVGPALAYQQNEGSGGMTTPETRKSKTLFGLGGKVGVGGDVHLSPRLGIALSALYRQYHFFGTVLGVTEYRGPAARVGLTYRY